MIPEAKLTGAEHKVLAAFRAGDTGVDAAGAEIRGDFLRGLFLGDYDEKADYRGTGIVNANISEVLDMEFCESKLPVRFCDCSFIQEVRIQHLTCPELDFGGCVFEKGVDARRAKVDGSVNLTKVNAMDYVNLLGANIGGQLDCTNGDFQNKGKIALIAQSIKVVGGVFLCGLFKGEVNLADANIGGHLSCTGGSFQNKEWTAINTQNIKVAGAVFLNDNFSAEGEVDLSGAEILGELHCAGGFFQNKEGIALNAQNIKVAAGVFLNSEYSGSGHPKEFKAEGEVSLAGSEIGGQLDCAGGNFQNEEGIALFAQGIKVASDMFLCSVFNGGVNLANVEIGKNLIIRNCKLAHLSLAGANVSGEFQDDSDVYKSDKGGYINLNIDGFRYQRLGDVKDRVKDRLAWVGSMSKGDEFRPQPYEQLMKVYREMGHMNWARRVGFELERKRHKQLRLNRDHKRFVVLGWAWWMWYWILRGTIGYGYKPFRAITRWFAPLIVAGFVLFSGMLPCPNSHRAESEPCHCMAPSDAEVLLSDDWKIRGKLPKDYPDFNPYYYAVEAALPVLPLGQTENCHPKIPWVRWAQGVITIIGALALTILASYGVGVLGPRWKDG